MMFLERKTFDTELRKEEKDLKLSSSKWRGGSESHIDSHLFERTLVVAASLVERKERMRQIIGSGRELILSLVGIDRDI